MAGSSSPAGLEQSPSGVPCVSCSLSSHKPSVHGARKVCYVVIHNLWLTPTKQNTKNSVRIKT